MKGRKRHAMVDTDGRGLKLHAHPADVQDRDGAGPLVVASRARLPFFELVFADGGYQGDGCAGDLPHPDGDRPQAAKASRLRRPATRWVVERFFAWISRNRRLAKRFRSLHRLRRGVPLRRFRYAPATPVGSMTNRFEKDFRRQDRPDPISGRTELVRPWRDEPGRAVGLREFERIALMPAIEFRRQNTYCRRPSGLTRLAPTHGKTGNLNLPIRCRQVRGYAL